jgi:hypothetical protein
MDRRLGFDAITGRELRQLPVVLEPITCPFCELIEDQADHKHPNGTKFTWMDQPG